MPKKCRPATAAGCVHAGDGFEVDIEDGKVFAAVDKVDVRATRAMDTGDVQFHHLRVVGHVPGAQVQRTFVGGAGIVHAQRHGRQARRTVVAGGGGRCGVFHHAGVRVDDDVHFALAVQQHLARSVARHRVETQLFQHLAQRLRLVAGVFDVFDAAHPNGVGRFAYGLTVGGSVGHGGGWCGAGVGLV